MRLPFGEILLRTKGGPFIEEKAFDLSIFKKTQALQKKYRITYDPESPLDTTGDLADRVYQAGRELFLDLGTYCTTTRRTVRVTEPELQAEMDACPSEVELGQGDNRVLMAHRDVEGIQDPIVIAGIQTAPFSDEEMMFTIYKGCALDRCVDGIWGESCWISTANTRSSPMRPLRSISTEKPLKSSGGPSRPRADPV